MTDPVLAGTQQVVQEALLAVANGGNETSSIRVTQVQRVPELNDASAQQQSANDFVLLFPGVMLVLASTIALQFTMAPLSTEKFKEVVRSFVLVGVKLRVYLHQWELYLSLNALVTAAALTGISIGANIFSASSPGLVFVSHYLGLVHAVSVALLLTHVSNQEELTQGLPWLMAIGSVAVGVALLLLQDPDGVLLTLFSVLSPFVGMLQYSAIYGTYDSEGLEVGIHAGDNVVESGLMGYMLAQAGGILLWNFALLWWIRPRQHRVPPPPGMKSATTMPRRARVQRTNSKHCHRTPTFCCASKVWGTHTSRPAAKERNRWRF